MLIKLQQLSQSTLNKILLLFIIGTRCIQYFSNPAIHYDEAALALNMMQRSFRELLAPLDYYQAAPVGFLMVSKLNVSLFGADEYILRLYPLLMGILSAFLLYRLTQNLAPRAVPFVLFLFGASNIFIQYSAEFKQYGSDATIAILLFLATFKVIRDYDNKSIWIWGLIASIAVWFSHAAVFVIAGIGIVLIISRFLQKDWYKLRNIIIACAISASSFLIVYLNFYKFSAQNTELGNFFRNYWQQEFLQLDPISFITFFLEIFFWIGGINQLGLLVIVIVVFIIGVLRTPVQHTLLLLMPTAITMIASLLVLYPLSDRLILFLLPAFIILVGVGFQDIYWRFASSNRYVVNILFGIIAIVFLAQLNVTQAKSEIRDALQFIASQSDNSHVFITDAYHPAALYYDFSHESLSSETRIPDTQHDEAIWFIYDQYGFQQIAAEGLETADISYSMKGLNIYCFDGILEECSAP